MALPGEKAAYQTLYSPFSSSMDKAEAAVKIAEVAEVRRHNAESDARYRARQDALKGVCPTCGR
jgi:rubrerythrin